MEGNEKHGNSRLHNVFETLATAGTNHIVPDRGLGLSRFLSRTGEVAQPIEASAENGPVHEVSDVDPSNND